jgi:hypothetical protein
LDIVKSTFVGDTPDEVIYDLRPVSVPTGERCYERCSFLSGGNIIRFLILVAVIAALQCNHRGTSSLEVPGLE